LQAAVQCFEQVTALDPDYALAYAGLADCYAIYRVYGWYSAEKSRQPALAAAARAMALDPSLAEVHFSQALVTFYFDRHWRAAESHLRRALSISPSFAMAQSYVGVVLASDYRFDEALAENKRACQLDPLSPYVYFLGCATSSMAGRIEDAEQAARRILELQPDSLMGWQQLSQALSRLGRHDEAVAAGERMVTLSRAPIYTAILGGILARAGRVDDAMRLLIEIDERASRGEYVSPMAALTIHVMMGSLDLVKLSLRACVDDATPPLILRAILGRELDAMRSDAEIDRLLDELYDGARPRS